MKSLFSGILLILIGFTVSAQCVYRSTSGTSATPGTWNGANWATNGNGSCNGNGRPSNPTAFGSIATGETINIDHYITRTVDLEINAGTRIVIRNGGTLDMSGRELSTNNSNPFITIEPGGTLKIGSLAFANGTFSNSGTVTSTGNMNFTAGTVRLSNSGFSFAQITAPNIMLTNSSTIGSIDGRLNITGNLDVTSSASLTINYLTYVSGYINFAGGTNMRVSNGVTVEAQNIYVQNNSNLVVNGFLKARSALRIGWTPSNTQSGSSRISGSGNITWGSLAIDNNNNYIDCSGGPNVGYGCADCAPPNGSTPNPLNMVNCGSGILPVKFVSVGGYPIENKVLIEWTTAWEQNNKKFIIERMENSSKVWEQIGSVDGELSSDIKNSYSYIDPYPFSSEHYYRVRQVDQDGKTDVSDVVFVKTAEKAQGIFPQPLTGNLLFVKYPELISWTISSISGNKLAEGFFNDESLGQIDVSQLNLKPDLYLIQVTTSQDNFIQKLLIGN